MKTLLAVSLTLMLAALAPASNVESSPESLMELGQWKRARAAVETLAKAKPNDAHTLYLQSRVKMMYGDLETAQKLAERAVGLDGRSAVYHWQLSRACGARAKQSGILKQMGLAKCFKKEAEMVLTLDPKHVEARTALVQFHMQAPGLVGGDKKKARSLADELVRLDPPQGYMALAYIAHAEKRTGEVEKLYQKALEADPQRYATLASLAGFYANSSPARLDLAEKHAREMLRIDPEQHAAYMLMAHVLAYQQRYAELDELLAAAESNLPENRGALYQAGRTLLTEKRELHRAEEYLRRYVEQEPEPLSPSLANARWRLGLVLEKQGRPREAVAELEASLRLNPGLEEAKKDLKRLKK